ncbi:MAG TPA: MFS transporter [Xanthobacteraceae bacterium]|nr:MFS transporter [Xanthobacteraceae bacterium]
MTPSGEAVSLVRHRPFVLFWLARTATTVALQMQAVAVSWQMYELTRDPLDLGLVGLTQFVPVALFVLVAGHAADRYDRRAIVRSCQFLAGLAVAMLAAGTAYDWLSRNAILAIVFMIGAARAFEATTLQTLLPAIVPPPMLPRAMAASSSATQLAVIAGPAVGGLGYAFSPVLVYALCCLLFISAGVLVSLIRVERTVPTREPVSFTVLFAGFDYIRRNKIVLGALSLDLFAVILGGATALMPVFAYDVFNSGPEGLGLMRAAPGAGALFMAIILTRWPPGRRIGRVTFGAVAVFGIATIVFAVSRSFVLSIAALVVLGAADMISVVIRQTLVQLETPDAMRGRVSAVNSLFVQASNQLGEFRAGLLASLIGSIPTVLVGGLGTLIVVVVGRKLFSELYRVDTFGAGRS